MFFHKRPQGQGSVHRVSKTTFLRVQNGPPGDHRPLVHVRPFPLSITPGPGISRPLQNPRCHQKRPQEYMRGHINGPLCDFTCPRIDFGPQKWSKTMILDPKPGFGTP